MKTTKLILPVILAMTAAGCATQPPAPVEQSYWKATNTDTRSALRSSPNVVEETESYATYEPQGTQALYHVVQSGDTLWQIAQKYDTDVNTIKSLNKLGTGPIYKGQRLMIAEATDSSVQPYSLTHRDKTDDKSTGYEPVPTTAPTAVPAESAEPTVSYELYRVRKGENLFRIGLKYHVSPLDIMAINDMTKPEDLQAGAVIKVPVVSKESTPTGTVVERTINEKLARQEGFIWPARGTIIGKFGRQGDGVVNNGIKIRVKESTPVYAAENGTVIYADQGLKTYGNLILLRHNNGVITAYAHNSQLMAKRGEKVKKGEVIALAGMTGNASEPQVHFEVRRNARAIDPLKVLPN